MKWERWHGFAAAGVLLLGGAYALGRCQSAGGGAGVVDAGSPVVEAPSKAPDDLLAELYIASPNTTWTKLQRGIGGALGILPQTMPAMVVAVSDLDAQLSGELDGTSPIHGALAGDVADPAWAVAMKLVDGRRARSILVDGDTSRFSGREAPGMTVLLPKRPASPGEKRNEVAITTNGWLLVARRAEDLPVLGTWVTRAQAMRPAPSGTASAIVDVPRTALATSLAPRLKGLWIRAKGYLVSADERMRSERGRAPDFADPAAIVAAVDGLVTHRIDVVGDLEKVRIVIDVSEDAASFSATLTPMKGTGPAQQWLEAMKTGDAAAALAMPSSAAVALSMRDGDAIRDGQAKSLEGTIVTALGARLKDPAPVHAVIESLTKARDEAFALALMWDEPTGTFLSAPIRDAAAANRAIGGFVDLVKVDPFKEMLRVQSVTSSTEELPGIGKASVATFARAAKPDAGAPRGSGAAWIADDKTLTAALGAEPLVTLKASAKPSKRLSEEPTLQRFVTAIANDASTIIVAQPLRFDPKRAQLPTTPLAIAVGKRASDGFVRVDVPDPLLREIVRSQMGF